CSSSVRPVRSGVRWRSSLRYGSSTSVTMIMAASKKPGDDKSTMSLLSFPRAAAGRTPASYPAEAIPNMRPDWYEADSGCGSVRRRERCARRGEAPAYYGVSMGTGKSNTPRATRAEVAVRRGADQARSAQHVAHNLLQSVQRKRLGQVVIDPLLAG